MPTTFACVGGPLDGVQGIQSELDARLADFREQYVRFNRSARQDRRNRIFPSIYIHKSVFRPEVIYDDLEKAAAAVPKVHVKPWGGRTPNDVDYKRVKITGDLAIKIYNDGHKDKVLTPLELFDTLGGGRISVGVKNSSYLLTTDQGAFWLGES